MTSLVDAALMPVQYAEFHEPLPSLPLHPMSSTRWFYLSGLTLYDEEQAVPFHPYAQGLANTTRPDVFPPRVTDMSSLSRNRDVIIHFAPSGFNGMIHMLRPDEAH